MKKTRKSLVFALVLAMMLTMFAGMQVMAAETETTANSWTQLRSAVETGTSDVVILTASFYWDSTPDAGIVVSRPVTIKSDNPANPRSLMMRAMPSRLHFTINSGGNLTLENVIVQGYNIDGSSGMNAKGGIVVNNGGELTIKGSTVKNCWVTTRFGSFGGVIYVNGGKVSIIDSMIENNRSDSGGAICGVNGAELNVIDSTIRNNYASVPGPGTGSGIIVDSTAKVTFEGDVVLDNPNTEEGMRTNRGDDVIAYDMTEDIKPDIPVDPDPLTSIGGDAGITITRPDPMLPFLVNPESAQVKEVFAESNILGGTGFNFGEHKYTSAPQEINSLNSLSMIYGYLDPFNEVFTVTCEISDFLLEDETPLFTDFSLYMGRQSNYFDRDFEGEYYASSKAKVYESKASFELAKNDPVVVVRTDAVGYVLTNYVGVLKLQQDTTKTVGQANATITWEIGIEVI